MVHRLAKPNEPRHASGMSPLTASLRYRCGCTGGEVIAINVVIGMDYATPEMFAATMRQLWLDMQTEIRQHTADGQAQDG